jgi:predicted aldo/keto reductase-like oxidoreductase
MKKVRGLWVRPLRGGYREKVKVATKLPCWKVKNAKDFDRFLDEQMERLEMDHLDFYLLHSLDKKNWRKVRDLGVLEWGERAISKGQFSYMGFSFHDDTETFKKIVDAYDWSMCLIQHNYLDIKNQAGTGGLRYAAEKGIAVAIMEPLLGGNLAVPPAAVKSIWEQAPVKRSPVNWALQWLWNQPEISTVLSGMNTMKQVEENIAHASASGIGTLTSRDIDIIDRVREKYEELAVIPCTDCKYCMPCPQGVNIPRNFSLYNEGLRFNKQESSRKEYKRWKQDYDKKRFSEDIRAFQCTGCRECEDKCPQGIPVSRWMPIIHSVLGEERHFMMKPE